MNIIIVISIVSLFVLLAAIVTIRMSDSEDEVVNKQIKIVFLGDVSVGKTSIIKRFCYDEFSRQYIPTVGADFYMKRKILNGHNETVFKISDIGGQEDKMLDKYLFDVDIVVLVYDITNLSSFENLSNWVSRLKQKDAKISTAIVGNKCDMEHQRAVRLDRSRQFAEQNGLMGHNVVSARTGEAVSACILGLVAQYLGIPLARSDQEQRVMRAELADEVIRAPHRYPTGGHHRRSPTSSGICTLQ